MSASSRRTGFTLLELIIATTMMTTMATAAALVLRGSHTAWEAQQQDLSRIETAQALLRHFVRQARQATAVSQITASGNTTGSISLLMPSGNTYVWTRDGTTNDVNFGLTTADQLLAENITSLRFVGYAADATTQTAVPEEIHCVRCIAQVVLPQGGGVTRTVSSWVWLRSW